MIMVQLVFKSVYTHGVAVFCDSVWTFSTVMNQLGTRLNVQY